MRRPCPICHLKKKCCSHSNMNIVWNFSQKALVWSPLLLFRQPVISSLLFRQSVIWRLVGKCFQDIVVIRTTLRCRILKGRSQRFFCQRKTFMDTQPKHFSAPCRCFFFFFCQKKKRDMIPHPPLLSLCPLCWSDCSWCGRLRKLFHAEQQARGTASPPFSLWDQSTQTRPARVGALSWVHTLQQQLHPNGDANLTQGVSP